MINPIIYLSHSTNQYKHKVFTKGFNVRILPFRDIPTLTASGGYSTMQYKNGYRLKSNVIGFCPVIILDVDTKPNHRSYSIQQLQTQLAGLNAIIVTTVSHSNKTVDELNTETHKIDPVPQHRLRVLIPLTTANGITTLNYKSFLKTAIQFCRLDPRYLDSSCFSTDRQYAPNPNQVIYHLEGDDIPTDYILSICEERNPIEETQELNTFIYKAGDLKGTPQDQKDYIHSNTTPELTALILKSRGYRVTASLQVFYDNRESNNLSIDPKTGLLRDWRSGKSYSTIDMTRRFIDHTLNKDLTLHLTQTEAIAYIVDLLENYYE